MSQQGSRQLCLAGCLQSPPAVGKVEAQVKVEKKESDLRSILPSTSAYIRTAASLPTVASVAWSIVVWAVDVRTVKKWRPVDPGATQVETESHRGVDVEGWDRLYDDGWLCQLALQIGTRGGLAVELIC